MRSVRRKNTGPELVVRSVLHRMGHRFALHRRDLPGSPDVVLPRHKVAISVNGCFSHGHTVCRHGRTRAKKNRAFWDRKIRANKERDEMTIERLRDLGWRPVTIWECECKSRDRLREILVKRMGDL